LQVNISLFQTHVRIYVLFLTIHFFLRPGHVRNKQAREKCCY
jgi:hypothetical protein